jgi:hypothetical protein
MRNFDNAIDSKSVSAQAGLADDASINYYLLMRKEIVALYIGILFLIVNPNLIIINS